MDTKMKLNLIETILIFIIGLATVITQPPLPLLGIPFVAIIGMRSVFGILENAHRDIESHCHGEANNE